MRKFLFIALLLFFCSFTPLFAGVMKAKPKNDYIERFAPIAKVERDIFSIPAAITLAQGILESGWGEGRFAAFNNHFGIKCHDKWLGPVFYVTDDDYDENGVLIESCFRAYDQVADSFRDHSLFLQRSRYSKLYDYGNDYLKWARGLQEAKYATDPLYAEKLIRIIEQYELYKYDGLESPIVDVETPNFDEVEMPKAEKVIKANSTTSNPNDGTLFEITPTNEQSFDEMRKEELDNAPAAERIPTDYTPNKAKKDWLNSIQFLKDKPKNKEEIKKKNWEDEIELDEIQPKGYDNNTQNSSTSIDKNKSKILGLKAITSR